MTLPRPDEWVFFRDLAGAWRWEQRRAGKLLQESIQGFETRDECLADAEHNGFLASPASNPPDYVALWAPDMRVRRES